MAVSLCRFKEIAGKPREGVHKYRFMGIAIYDFLATAIFAIVCAYFVPGNYSYVTKFGAILTASIIAGIIVHRLFCVNTALNVAIFGEV